MQRKRAAPLLSVTLLSAYSSCCICQLFLHRLLRLPGNWVDLSLFVLAGLERFALRIVAFKQPLDLLRNSHFHLVNLKAHYNE